MLYVQRTLNAPLDAYVESIWLARNGPRPRALERILPIGRAQLIVNLAEDETRLYQSTAYGVSCEVSSGSILSGLTTSFQIIDTAEQEYVAGVVFRPAGTGAFLRIPASQLSNRQVPLEDLWGRGRSNRLREELLAATTPEAALDVVEAWLLGSWRGRPCHPAVAFALHRFHSSPAVPPIRTITDAISFSPKRFIERFEAEVGLTPKRYCRLLRFQRAVATAHGTGSLDWTQLALDCGYFDQAHFIHDFRRFSGITPSMYAEGITPFQNHVTFLQSTKSSIA
jgi:AraC-like DNA-binding protein